MYEGTLIGLAGHIVVLSLLGMTFILTAIFMVADTVTEEDKSNERSGQRFFRE